MRRFHLPIQLTTLCGVLAAGGCAWFSDPPQSDATPASTASSSGANYYVVKADFTPLYRTGPQQPNGPDQSLPKNTLVTLLQRSFGFSRVQLENGINGYVATEDLGPAPAELVHPPKPTIDTNTEHNSAIVEHYSAEKAEKSAAVSTGNAEAAPELPEPRLEPEPTPVIAKPDFRY
jgi:hypothetical protein